MNAFLGLRGHSVHGSAKGCGPCVGLVETKQDSFLTKGIIASQMREGKIITWCCWLETV